MNIWRIDTRQDKNVFLECEEEEWKKLDKFLVGESIIDRWDPTLDMKLNKRRTNIDYSDALMYDAGYFILSEKAVNIFNTFASETIECLDFRCSEGHYVFVNPIEFVDCLDMEKSKYKVYKGDSNIIQYYKKLCFRKNSLSGKHLFRICHMDEFIMACSDEFKAAIEDAKLIGFNFELLSDEIV